jgi:hypothetical protein
MQELYLSNLKVGLPGISEVTGAYHAEACLVCFDLCHHPVGVDIEVKGIQNCHFRIIWSDVVTDQIRRSWNDFDDATENGACGIAFLLILALTKYTVIERARKGGGFDYYLGYKDTLIFQSAARLEVSGILRAASENDIEQRIRRKLEQTRRSDGSLPAYIVVVEFAKPVSYVVKK